MALREIIKDGNPFLRKKSREVTTFDHRLHTLLDDMAETMRASYGVGLAAVQVGVLRRVITVDLSDPSDPESVPDLVELINPKIVEESEEKQNGPEGCLSFPNEWGMVERPMRVKIQAQDRNGDLFFVEGEELKARAFCHEIDHLDGVLFVDRATEMLEGPEEE
jgi:peptide deformylase